MPHEIVPGLDFQRLAAGTLLQTLAMFRTLVRCSRCCLFSSDMASRYPLSKGKKTSSYTREKANLRHKRPVSTSLHADADATGGGLWVQVADGHFLRLGLLANLAMRQGTWVALVSGSTATMQVPT